MVRLQFVLDHWKTVREDSALAVESMPPGSLDFRPREDMMSFREVARHIAADGVELTRLLLAGETDLSTPDFGRKRALYREPFPEAPAAMAATLRDTVNRHCAALAARPAVFFAELVRRWDGLDLTRLEMVQLILEHELAHRMQLFVYLRMNGVVPPTTRRKMAAGKA
jgi:uncharacterized damage-inducible protein DinB